MAALLQHVYEAGTLHGEVSVLTQKHNNLLFTSLDPRIEGIYANLELAMSLL